MNALLDTTDDDDDAEYVRREQTRVDFMNSLPPPAERDARNNVECFSQS